MKVLNFINGEFTEARCKQELANICPATGQTLGTMPASKFEDIQDAVQAAVKSQKKWAEHSYAERAAYLYELADLILDHREELAVLESQDQGKPVWLARSVDIPRAEANFRFFAQAVEQRIVSATQDEGVLNFSSQMPYGVCGLISPWNLPLYLLTWKIAPAIAMGNSVVAKPAELTPLTAFRFAQLVEQSSIPNGIINIVFGEGNEAGQALVENRDVSMISFTGGTETGKKIQSTAAQQLKKTSLELGGKNPNIIFADCDKEQMLATTLRSSFINQGEVCLCGSRIFVERSYYKDFLQEFVNQTKKLITGDPSKEETFIGALVSASHLEKVKGYIEIAKTLGGEVLCGGTKPANIDKSLQDGFYLEPTVISGLAPDCQVNQEEIFGPIVTVTPFDDVNEAVELANSVSYGLSASLWTQDINKAHQVAERIQAGQVWINSWMKRDLRVPFGGMKASGMGRAGGSYSLSSYSQLKNTTVVY